MTKFDFKVIINVVRRDWAKNQKCKIEIYTKSPQQICQYNYLYETCYNNGEMAMTKLKNNLKEITYYLIQQFYKTGKKYSCTQTKLGKLISILAFKYARKGQLLFDETIYKYPPRCGTLIKTLTFVPKSIYIRDIEQENPDKTSEICDRIDDNIEIPIKYREIDTLSIEVKKEIEKVFLLFGAYPADDLGKLLNPIVDAIVVPQGEELVLSQLEKLNVNSFSAHNQIIDYIYQ